jgi:hypothetical protein
VLEIEEAESILFMSSRPVADSILCVGAATAGISVKVAVREEGEATASLGWAMASSTPFSYITCHEIRVMIKNDK